MNGSAFKPENRKGRRASKQHDLCSNFVLYRQSKRRNSHEYCMRIPFAPTHPSASSSLVFALWCKSPSAFAGSHLTLTFSNKPMNVNTIHPKCPWNQPPLIPTAYKLAIPTGAMARIPQLIVNATAFNVAKVSGLGAISFKHSWMHANDIAMPEPRKMVVNAAVQNAGRRLARRSSLSDGYKAISMGHAMQQMRKTVPVLVLRCR
jgi:hypothetical protein